MRKGFWRDKEKEDHWRKIIARFAASELRPMQFCKQEGLKPDVLRYWRVALAKRDAEQIVVKAARVKTAGATFVPLVVADGGEKTLGTQPMPVAEICFSGGSVTLFSGISPDTVRTLLLAIRNGGM